MFKPAIWWVPNYTEKQRNKETTLLTAFRAIIQTRYKQLFLVALLGSCPVVGYLILTAFQDFEKDGYPFWALLGMVPTHSERNYDIKKTTHRPSWRLGDLFRSGPDRQFRAYTYERVTQDTFCAFPQPWKANFPQFWKFALIDWN